MQPIGLSLSRLSTKWCKWGCQFSELGKISSRSTPFPPVLILPDSLSKKTESIKRGLLKPLIEWLGFSLDGLKSIS